MMPHPVLKIIQVHLQNILLWFTWRDAPLLRAIWLYYFGADIETFGIIFMRNKDKCVLSKFFINNLLGFQISKFVYIARDYRKIF